YILPLLPLNFLPFLRGRNTRRGLIEKENSYPPPVSSPFPKGRGRIGGRTPTCNPPLPTRRGRIEGGSPL
ncbi:hypothetical protein J7J39_01875, partial [bacterium]|nr:hypothetical protein [bacterium]